VPDVHTMTRIRFPQWWMIVFGECSLSFLIPDSIKWLFEEAGFRIGFVLTIAS